MTADEMHRSIEAHDRQLDTIIGLLASLADRLSSLVHPSEIQDARIKRLEDAQ